MTSRSTKRGSRYAKKINPITFHIAYEGAVAEKEYFEVLSTCIPKRFSKLLKLVPVDKTSTKSTPQVVLSDLKSYLTSNSIRLSESDVAYIVIDVDHYFTGQHQLNTRAVIQECSQKGINVSISNPCVEVWFLSHYVDISSLSNKLKAKYLLNKNDFLKKEFKKQKGKDDIKIMVGKTNVALENIEKLNSLIQLPNGSPPDGLTSQVNEIIKKMNENFRIW